MYIYFHTCMNFLSMYVSVYTYLYRYVCTCEVMGSYMCT